MVEIIAWFATLPTRPSYVAQPWVKPMRASKPFQTSPLASELAIQARGLRSIADGIAVEPLLHARLKKAGLIVASPIGWVLTGQGKIALAFAIAH